MGQPSSEMLGFASFGLQQASNNINMANQHYNNKRQRKYNEERYNIERQHALQDWQMENAYNSPAAQMQRLKEAGLNPNLVYGNGATAEGGSVRNTNTHSWNPQAPQTDMSGFQQGFMSYIDAGVKQAQTDNLKVQNTVLEQEAILKTAQTLATLAGTDKTKVETSTLSQLQEITVEAAKANLNKLAVDTKATSDANTRSNDLHAGNLKEQKSRIENMAANTAATKMQTAKTQSENLNIRKQYNLMIQEGILKNLEIDVRSRGGNPNDAYWEKKLQQVVEYILEGGKDWKKYFQMITRENRK